MGVYPVQYVKEEVVSPVCSDVGGGQGGGWVCSASDFHAGDRHLCLVTVMQLMSAFLTKSFP